ncbi:MAG TPA: nuclear transport factor 2 family protein [Gemmata sp.]|nr:nuclear transport factor 2 family protein [Gemmata sp.]
MAVEELVAKIRAAYKRWHDTRGHSVADWTDLMADDVKIRSVADGADGMKFSAPRDGIDAATGYFSALADEWEMIHHTVEELLVDGDRVAAFGRCAFKNLRTGKTADTPFAHRWRLRDGRIAEYFEIYDTAKAFAAATPDPA